jgi:catechol 2,3-dioxygenase-like lactoylglutathione lyase family enzyme
MRFTFEDTGLRVRNLDRAVAFFTETLGMRLEARVKADWTKGEFANLFTSDGKHKLELNWYAADSPVAGPFREGDELDHLGFAVDDFDGALRRLADAGFKPALGPFHEGGWHIAFVPVVEGIWLDVFHVDAERPKATPRKKASRRRKR